MASNKYIKIRLKGYDHRLLDESSKKIIDAVGKNLMFYLRELEDEREGKKAKSGLSNDGRDQIEKILDILKDKFGYSHEGSISCLKYLIKKRYDTAH